MEVGGNILILTEFEVALVSLYSPFLFHNLLHRINMFLLGLNTIVIRIRAILS